MCCAAPRVSARRDVRQVLSSGRHADGDRRGHRAPARARARAFAGARARAGARDGARGRSVQRRERRERCVAQRRRPQPGRRARRRTALGPEQRARVGLRGLARVRALSRGDRPALGALADALDDAPARGARRDPRALRRRDRALQARLGDADDRGRAADDDDHAGPARRLGELARADPVRGHAPDSAAATARTSPAASSTRRAARTARSGSSR